MLIRPLLVLFTALAVLTGIAYPTLITAIGHLAFAAQADGSLLEQNGKVIGSKLIGQSFNAPQYFWGRPSATTPAPYNAQSSSGSNLGPINPTLADAVKTRIASLRAADPNNIKPVPIDLVTASASGLDPEISPAAAYYQATRIARVRKVPVEQVEQLIKRYIQDRQFGLLGEARVNVLELNLGLDRLASLSFK